MTGKEKDLMGYDPLEWLKEESAETSPETTEEPVQLQADTEETVSDESQNDTENRHEAVPQEAAPNEGPADIQKSTGKDTILDLENSLQIMDVATLRPKLESSLAELKEITLRAAQDITVDGAGMQLLLAFVRQAAADNVNLQWEELPPPIAEAAKLLDIKQVMLND